MAQQVHLYTANTSRRGDNSTFIGTVKVVKGKTVQRDEDCDARVVTLHFIRMPVALRKMGPTQLWNALGDHYNQRCSHEFDCCGCYFGGVSDVKWIDSRNVVFKTSYSRNL